MEQENILNSVSKRRDGEYSDILEVPANSSLVLNLNVLSDKAPFLNAILRNMSSNNIKFYLNNRDEFRYLAGGEIRQIEANNFQIIIFENTGSSVAEVVVEFNNEITLFELEKLKVGVMKYGFRS